MRNKVDYTYWANRQGEQPWLWKDVLVKCTETNYDANGVQTGNAEETPYLYDAIGNITSDGTWTYEWEAGRKLKQMEMEDLQHRRIVLAYAYDHNGLRTQKVVSEYDANQQLVRVSTTDYTLHGKLVMHMKKHTVEGNTENTEELHFFYDANSRGCGKMCWSNVRK